MRYAVLGTGMVGQAISSRLAGLGHDVVMGSRDAANPKALAWAAEQDPVVRVATFAAAASDAPVVVNATGGAVSLDVLRAAGDLNGKVIVDISNPIDPDSGSPPSLTVANTDSIGEQLQAAFPSARVVKSLNTVTAAVMVDPSIVPGDHLVFVAGNDPEAKATVAAMLGEFDWPADRILDLGDITAARATEMYLPLWLRLYGAAGHHFFNIALMRGQTAS